MGLEVSTYIAGLTATWPPAGDTKSQGDDHLRLVKSVLQNTFPSGDRPFYFPKTEAISGTLSLDATDQNNMVEVTTTAGDLNVFLPAGLGVGNKGWACEIIKVSNDANAAIVRPASGTISSKVGATDTIRVGILCEPARFIWNGSTWYCAKTGPMIGSTESFDGAAVPPGYLLDNGQVYSNLSFAELFAVLGTSTLKDKRGRAEIGSGTGAGLTNRVLGGLYGEETHLPTLAEMFPHNHTGSTGAMSGNAVHGHTVSGGTIGGASTLGAATGGGYTGIQLPTAIVVDPVNLDHLHGISSQGSGTAFNVMQPSVATQKIKRAC